MSERVWTSLRRVLAFSAELGRGLGNSLGSGVCYQPQESR
jgi:hypothetical protein